MSFSFDLPASSVIYTGALAATVFVLVKLIRPSRVGTMIGYFFGAYWVGQLDALPTIGPKGWFSFWGARSRFTTSGVNMVQEGYLKYKSMPFKVADKDGWIVVLGNREHIEELRKAPEDELSFVEAINEQLSTRYTVGDDVHDIPYHVPVIRSQVTRNIGAVYPEIRDEVEASFNDILDLNGHEWKSVVALNVTQRVVCRTSNRIFVGHPLCRNPEWIKLNVRYTFNVIMTAFMLSLFPRFTRRLVAGFFTSVSRDITLGVKFLTPIINDRLKHLEESGGNWVDKPKDLISWLMEEASGSQLAVKPLTIRVLHVNFTAIHTSSNSFTHALLYLAANPRFIQPLREEVDAIIEKEGWSKMSLGKMHKVDSFLRECQRLEGLGSLSVMRKAMKDYTFSDGTCIPRGTMIGIPTLCLHRDPQFYERPNDFEPFRFADMQDAADGGEGDKHQFVSTSMEYQPFGHGIHACPGRFLAASEMKTMLAHIVVTYDVKLEEGAPPPRRLCFGNATPPDSSAKVLFRRRVD